MGVYVKGWLATLESEEDADHRHDLGQLVDAVAEVDDTVAALESISREYESLPLTERSPAVVRAYNRHTSRELYNIGLERLDVGVEGIGSRAKELLIAFIEVVRKLVKRILGWFTTSNAAVQKTKTRLRGLAERARTCRSMRPVTSVRILQTFNFDGRPLVLKDANNTVRLLASDMYKTKVGFLVQNAAIIEKVCTAGVKSISASDPVTSFSNELASLTMPKLNNAQGERNLSDYIPGEHGTFTLAAMLPGNYIVGLKSGSGKVDTTDWASTLKGHRVILSSAIQLKKSTRPSLPPLTSEEIITAIGALDDILDYMEPATGIVRSIEASIESLTKIANSNKTAPEIASLTRAIVATITDNISTAVVDLSRYLVRYVDHAATYIEDTMVEGK